MDRLGERDAGESWSPSELEKVLKLFRGELKVVNVGLELFFDDLVDQSVKAVHVRWNPVRRQKIDKDLEGILDKIL